MKKVMSALAVSAMLMSALPLSVMDAAARISIYINDTELPSMQAPVMKAGRVLVPLRSIFEGLDADVQYSNKTKKITATRGDQEVSLTLGSKAAYINGQLTKLDVPASTIKGNTMVPIRFVSEAFGEKVFWNSRNQRVDIKTTTASEPPIDDTQYSAWNIYGSVSGSNGDGRDLTVSFTRAMSEKTVSAYRVMLVKTRNVNTFNETAAAAVPSGNYTSITPNGSNPKLTLNAQTRDVNGDLLNSNETYRLYVLTVGNSSNNYKNTLGWSSQSLKLNNVRSSVQAVTNLRAADVSDYGDGRDMEINFTQPSTTSNITYYRAFVVKAKDASSFNLDTANKVSNANSTIIYKGSSNTVKSQLTSSSRDTSGELIKSGTSYVVYIMSVSTNTSTDSKLSSASSSLTLSVNTASAPVITQVRDISDYGDGRDIQVSFNRSSDESKVANYRVFVVRNTVASSFNLTTASNLSSSLYYTVNKTGNNITVNLPSNMRDTSGYNVTNLQDYRIFVMAAGTQQNNYTNALSASSSVLRLTSNSTAGVASNLSVTDIADNGNGSDLRVSFTKASDESSISHYRVFVVPASYAGSFNLNSANSSSYYTQVNKTGSNLTVNLQSNTRDTFGNLISNGLPYRVFVLSVNNNGNWSQNALSSSSAQITLTQNAALSAPTNVTAADVADNGNANDIQVTFNRSANEANVSQYRVFVVKANSSLSLSTASSLDSRFYTAVNKSNSTSFRLPVGTLTTDGSTIVNGGEYRVYVMAVNNNSSLSNALSSPSGVVKLNLTSAVQEASNVAVTFAEAAQATGEATDISINFTKPQNDAGIASYALMIVPSSQSEVFNLAAAKSVLSSTNSYLTVPKNGSSANVQPFAFTKDVSGNKIDSSKSYQVFVLSLSENNSRESSLSRGSNVFKINAKQQAQPIDVKAAVVTASSEGQIIKVNLQSDNEQGISQYRAFIVKDGSRFGLDEANSISADRYQELTKGDTLLTLSKDTSGQTITSGTYQIYVLSVAQQQSVRNALSNASKVTVEVPAQSSANPPAANVPSSDTPAS